MFTNLFISYIMILAATGLVYGILNHKKAYTERQLAYLYLFEKAYKIIRVPAVIVTRITKAAVKTIIKYIKFRVKVGFYAKAAQKMFN